MRRAFSGTKWIEEDGRIVGIFLGSDACAEHEWGTNDLNCLLGVDNNAEDPFDRHRITKFEDANHIYVKDSKEAMLIFGDNYFIERCKENGHDWLKNRELSLWGDKPLVCAWDGRSFGIRVSGDEEIARLDTLYHKLKELDMVKGLQQNNWIGGGIVFVIASELSEEYRENVRGMHRSHERLLEAVKKTKIENILAQNNKRYYALRPKWKDPKDESKGFHFWLNPMDQQDNNYGWFEVDDLLDWVKGVGKIPMKKK